MAGWLRCYCDWTIESTVQFIRQVKLTSVQLLLLTPLPGSELYYEEMMPIHRCGIGMSRRPLSLTPQAGGELHLAAR